MLEGPSQNWSKKSVVDGGASRSGWWRRRRRAAYRIGRLSLAERGCSGPFMRSRCRTVAAGLCGRGSRAVRHSVHPAVVLKQASLALFLGCWLSLVVAGPSRGAARPGGACVGERVGDAAAVVGVLAVGGPAEAAAVVAAAVVGACCGGVDRSPAVCCPAGRGVAGSCVWRPAR